MNKKRKFFDCDGFRSWMESQNDDEEQRVQRDIRGAEVLPKIPYKKLVVKMESEVGEVLEMAKEFRKEGGKVLDIDEQTLLIEVNAGTFYLSKGYVKRKSV